MLHVMVFSATSLLAPLLKLLLSVQVLLCIVNKVNCRGNIMASKGIGFGSFVIRGSVLLILALGIVLWFVPAPAMKWGIETYGSKYVGARVDVDDVSFSWLSLALAIEGLQVTNPDSPMENWVVVDRMATSVDVSQLLNKKLYFDELAVEGIALGEARSQSGALGPRPQPVASDDGGFSLASFGLPNPEDLVEQEKAIYEKKIKAYQAKLAAKREAIEKAVAELPDDESANAYKERIDAAKKKAKGPLGNFAALQDFSRIQKDIKKDVKKINNVQSLIKSTLADLKKDYDVLKNLPNQSSGEMIKTLGLENSMIANAGQTLLAGKFDAWIQQGLGIYDVVAGGDADGTDVASEEIVVKTSPDFLIKRMLLSGRLSQGGRDGEMNGVITNLNEAPGLLPEPITVDLKAAGESLGKLVLTSSIDHRKAGSENDAFEFSIVDSSLENYPLTEQSDLSLILNKALLSTKAKGTIRSLSTLDLSVDAAFSRIDLAADKKNENGESEALSDTQKIVLDALKGESEISFTAKASGPLDNPALSLTSNLDDVLSKAVNNVIKKKVDALKAEVSAKLQDELSKQLEPLKNSLNDIGGLSGEADGRKNVIEDLLKKI